mmetsp:Transcript_51503/g.129369  ORF Transcript_51503/g.129369 Transcript_51503/m.129369 type:complete len:223 (+) Transcript_51503:1412-2080(+)
MPGVDQSVDVGEASKLGLIGSVVDVGHDRRRVSLFGGRVEVMLVDALDDLAVGLLCVVELAHSIVPRHVGPERVQDLLGELLEYGVDALENGQRLAIALLVEGVERIPKCDFAYDVDRNRTAHWSMGTDTPSAAALSSAPQNPPSERWYAGTLVASALVANAGASALRIGCQPSPTVLREKMLHSVLLKEPPRRRSKARNAVAFSRPSAPSSCGKQVQSVTT